MENDVPLVDRKEKTHITSKPKLISWVCGTVWVKFFCIPKSLGLVILIGQLASPSQSQSHALSCWKHLSGMARISKSGREVVPEPMKQGQSKTDGSSISWLIFERSTSTRGVDITGATAANRYYPYSSRSNSLQVFFRKNDPKHKIHIVCELRSIALDGTILCSELWHHPKFGFEFGSII